MAYAAVISLKQTIHRLVNDSPDMSKMLQSASKEINSLQQILQGLQTSISDNSVSTSRIRSSQGAINALNEKIREAACNLEDALETQVSVQQEINSFKQGVKKMEDDYNRIKQELRSTNPLPEEDTDIGRCESKIDMVGLSDEFNKIDALLTKGPSSDLRYVTIVGMAGIGKTTLARNFFEDPSIQSCFPSRAFVTVGQKYQSKEIMLAILAQTSHGACRSVPGIPVGQVLGKYLQSKNYLIVLDDVWDRKFLESLFPLLKFSGRKGRIMVTTRIKEVALLFTSLSSYFHQMRFLNKEESLYLLREKVFGRHDQPFPDQKAAEKIAENCEGLPLAIIAVANLLSKAKKTPDYWKEVAAKESLIFREVGDDMIKVLISSYNYLPQHLKACFLYMGVFPPKCKIPASKLVKLWNAEGFLEPNWKGDSEIISRKCLEDLSSKSDLVLVRQQRSNISGIKTFSLHPVYWYLCNREATKEKFLHIVRSYVDSPTQGVESQRRLCIHNNVLFGIEDMRCSIESDNFSTARSLLCTGLYHQYPLPRICIGSRLLRVFDALTIRFYIFPIEIVELGQLRFLALTYSGNIPASISKLWKLEYLIVHQRLSDDQHLSVVSSDARAHLPIEIWNMQKLRCLQVMGSDLIIPNNDDGGALLSNLLTLSYMSADSCTKEILKRTPNLKKLGIQIELPPDSGATYDQPLYWFHNLHGHLKQLESLKCVVVNPNPRSQVFAFPLFFPSSLTKLSLSGLGYPWKYMTVIGQLPNLQGLKLRYHAFQGPTWLINGFEKLRFLLIEDTDLESLEFRSYPKSLRQVTIRHCYKLKKIVHYHVLEYPVKCELVDCPSALIYTKEMRNKYVKNISIDLTVESSWDEKKPKARLLPSQP